MLLLKWHYVDKQKYVQDRILAQYRYVLRANRNTQFEFVTRRHSLII